MRLSFALSKEIGKPCRHMGKSKKPNSLKDDLRSSLEKDLRNSLLRNRSRNHKKYSCSDCVTVININRNIININNTYI